MRLELEALKKAARAAAHSEEKDHLTNAVIFRKYRHAIYSGADTTKNLLELNEGMAEYTGVIVSGRDYHEMQKHFIASIDRFLGKSTFVRSFAYVTIPVYGYLHRDTKKNWNKEIDAKTDLTEYFLDAFQIQLPKDLEKAVRKVRGRYNWRTIHAEEAAREERIKKVIAEHMSKFVNRPHLAIHFEKMNMSFDPRNIMPLDRPGNGLSKYSAYGQLGHSHRRKGSPDEPQLGQNNGWTLELKDGYAVQKKEASNNYILIKK